MVCSIILSVSQGINQKNFLFGFDDAEILENVRGVLREAAGVDLLRPVLILLQLLPQLQHSLLPVRNELLQILITQLFPSAALASRLSRSLQLRLHVNLLGSRFPARFTSTLSRLFPLLLNTKREVNETRKVSMDFCFSNVVFSATKSSVIIFAAMVARES